MVVGPSTQSVAIANAAAKMAENHRLLAEGKLPYSVYELGDYKLQMGQTLKNAKLAYKVDCEWLVGEGLALDPKRYFIILTNAFGNGLSSSPSNQPAPYNGPRFPNVTLYDNVAAQVKLVKEHLGIKKVHAVLGWSMGAQQTMMWGALVPEMIDYIVPFCGSAKTSIHNFVFLEGPANALRADAEFKNGWYKDRMDVQKGLRAFARVYAGWGFSQAFYREKKYEEIGFNSVEDFLVGFWEGYFLQKDPNNLLAMLWTWQHADISANHIYNGDFKAALKKITCKAVVMPGKTDLYFPPEDNEEEVKHMPNAKLVPFDSIWGHWAGGPGTNPVDVAFLDNELRALWGIKT
ncbi:hypothetical protein HK101_006121 [Irineochytrium annulatum]|nr:hypothetical protein HK101_006121 [Irineochytrium annulatum]